MSSTKELGKKITETIDKAIFSVKHNQTEEGVKAAKSLLSNVNNYIQQYESTIGHHDDFSITAKGLLSKIESEIASLPCESHKYA